MYLSNPKPRTSPKVSEWAAQSLEAGKFFPQTSGGLKDPFAPDDVINRTPPKDGTIASAGNPEAAALDATGTDWPKHPVSSEGDLTVEWSVPGAHKVRRWNYFLTRQDWQPNKALSRTQFEDHPFATIQNSDQPYWAAGDSLAAPNPTRHTLRLPRAQGYHVLLAITETADTTNAFYQVADLSFS